MPELPEVESIRKQLDKFLKGHKIESVEVKNRRIFQGDEKEIVGAKFVNAERFGKVTVLNLSNQKSLLIHVKMTGQLIYRGPNLKPAPKMSLKVSGGVPGPHTHVIFNLDSGGVLYYNDLRRFGWLKIVDSSKLKVQSEFLGKLGPEPFRDLTFEYFAEILGKTRRTIKVLVMDQQKIAGVGNIYANDALFLARIAPTRPANSLSQKEAKKLFDAIHTVLEKGMKYGGSSENSFVTPDGQEGEYQRHTLVYGRQGQMCTNPACRQAGAKIQKVQLGGRGTYFCPNCQK
jgi:formamidopyrimidine-DNA glycosylase